MQSISEGLENVKKELVASANDGPVSEFFHKVMLLALIFYSMLYLLTHFSYRHCRNLLFLLRLKCRT